MKPFALLPLLLLVSSCYYPVPYAQQRPPQRNGEPYYPYHRGPRPPMDRYQPMDRNTPPPPQAYDRGRDGYEGRHDDDYEEPQVEERAPAAPQPQGRKEHPVAERTDKPGMVLSPYSPYNVIDVQDFKSGDLAKDPSNGKIFRVP